MADLDTSDIPFLISLRKRFETWLNLIVEELPRGQSLLIAVYLICAALIVGFEMGTSLRPEVVFGNRVMVWVPLLLLAWGAGLVLAAGKVDISVAGVAAVGGIVFAALTHLFESYGLALFGSLIIGAIWGAINGWLVSRRSAPPLITTWGVGVLAGVTASMIAYLGSRDKPLEGYSLSSISISGVQPTGQFLSDSPYLYAFLGVAVIVPLVLLIFRLGGIARIVGSNSQAASYAGFRTARIVFVLYVMSGILSALSGSLSAISSWSASTIGLVGYEMIAIAIAVIGGTVMSGGHYSLVGIAAAALAWVSINSWLLSSDIFSGFQASRFSQTIFAIVILLAALAFGKKMSGEVRTIQVDASSKQRVD